MRDDRVVDHREEARQEPKPGAQDRRNDRPSCDARDVGFLERRCDALGAHSEIVRRFVREILSEFFDQTAKHEVRRRLLAQARKTVGHRGVLDKGKVLELHYGTSYRDVSSATRARSASCFALLSMSPIAS